MYFDTLFHSLIFSKNTNNIIRIANGPYPLDLGGKLRRKGKKGWTKYWIIQIPSKAAIQIKWVIVIIAFGYGTNY